jgi:hypothetical protein
MTGHETFKQSNHLITYCLNRHRDKALAHRDGKNCAMPACHRDNSLLKNRIRNWMAAPVTQTTSTAEPLGLRLFGNNMTANAQARVWQAVPAAKHLLFYQCMTTSIINSYNLFIKYLTK